MNGREALEALQAILADPGNQWTISGETRPNPAETHSLADDLLVELVRSHIPDSEAFLDLYGEMDKWYV